MYFPAAPCTNSENSVMRQTLLEIPINAIWIMVSVLWAAFTFYSLYWIRSNWATIKAELNQSGPFPLLPAVSLPNTINVLLQVCVWGLVSIAIATIPQWSPFQKVPVFGYGFMLFIGFTVSGWTAARRAKQVGIASETIWDLAFWLFISGILGARLFFVIQYRANVFEGKHGLDIIKTTLNLRDGGLVLYGGIILAMIAYTVFCLRKKINPLLLVDVIIPSAFICLGFGRLGCFLNGCCYGDVCDLPWAISFPKESVPWVALLNRGYISIDASYSLALHPTQLYSSLNGFILAAVSAAYFPYRERNGSVLALTLLVYPITRFVIEYLRADEFGKWGTTLTISQIVSIVIFSVGVIFLYGLNCQRSPVQQIEITDTSTVAS